MNKEQFLNELKSKILSLTDEERNEAIQYYSDYFDEAGDDEKVIKELGTPDDVAKIIIEKFASAPAVQDKKNEDTEDFADTDNGRANIDEALFFTFEKDDVKNILLEFGSANVVMISGKNYAVETRGVTSDDFICTLDSKGTLSVSNTRRIPTFGLFSHDRKRRICPRILITIPESCGVFSLNIKIGAGSITAKDIDLSYQKGILEVGAGNLVLGKISGEKSNIRCGLGNLVLDGMLRGKINIDCGMGNVKLNIRGNIDDYSYDCKAGLGNIKINDMKTGAVAQNFAKTVKDSHLSVNCGLGNVYVKIEQ